MDRSLALLVLVAGCFYVTESERVARWDLDGDGVERPADCDDDDPDVSVEVAFFADTDQDGFGDPDIVELGCAPPKGFVLDDTDCDDTDRASFPGAVERCDGVDNDCDRQVDEELSALTWYRDADGDGFGVEGDVLEDCAPPDGYADAAGDCDDGDPNVHPDAVEVCNEIDDDCAGGVDEEDPGLVPLSWHADLDLDGFGAGVGTPGCSGPPGTVPNDDDCDDDEPLVNPDAEELCNGIDDDCDEDVDVDATDLGQYFEDADGDGYGDAASSMDVCPPAPPGYVSNPGDCDDTDGAKYPGAVECIDNVDNDCDGLTDESGC